MIWKEFPFFNSRIRYLQHSLVKYKKTYYFNINISTIMTVYLYLENGYNCDFIFEYKRYKNSCLTNCIYFIYGTIKAIIPILCIFPFIFFCDNFSYDATRLRWKIIA